MSTTNQPDPPDVPEADPSQQVTVPAPPVSTPPPSPTGVTAAADEPAPHRSGLDSHGRVRRTRAATAWASAVALALVTILFVVFVVQNSQKITIKFLWMQGELAAASGLLIAAVAGALLVGIPAAVRIGQLRRSLKRNA
ncbi:MAG: hypothetical protein JWQ74_413 [Marmoricola sp.]|nr:hypothetical protein [Marmoricola sp.]